MFLVCKINSNKNKLCITNDYIFAIILGTLRFGRFDVTETQISIIFVHIMSAVFGTSIWDIVVSNKYYCVY
jgi:hypothetical protein